MSGISMGHSYLRPCSGEKTLRRRRNNAPAENVIHIDGDSEDNVIIIDLPEYLPNRKLGSGRPRKEKLSQKDVIYIDDDETPDVHHSIDVNNVSFSADTFSNGIPCHATTNISDSTDVVEECQFVPDKSTPVRLSKCKRTYSGKTYEGNRYGLNSDSSDSSDDEYLDCELVEDGKVQELWEKAFSRRRKGTYTGCSSSRGHDNISQDIDKDQYQKVGTKDATAKHKEASFSFGKEKFNSKSDSSYSSGKDDNGIGCSGVFGDFINLDFSQSAEETHLHSDQFEVHGRSTYQAKGSPSFYDGHDDLPEFGPGSFEGHVDGRWEHVDVASSNFSIWDDNKKPAFDSEKSPAIDTCPPNVGPCVDQDQLCSENFCSVEDEDYVCKCKMPTETEVMHDESFPSSSANNFQEWDNGNFYGDEHMEFEQPHATSSSINNVVSEGCPFKRSTLPCSPSSSLPREEEIEQVYSQENRESIPDTPLFKNSYEKTKPQEDSSLSNGQLENEDGQVHIQNGDTCPSWDTDVIIDREKLKETDEYKRALEEESASRKQALAIQAEEAQRLRQLRKRQRAESMRVLDMERRQKQRLEEIRDTQKKDVENMNLKEAIRAGVRKDLTKLETTCQNMASLLQLLGIHVNGWPHPLPQQVQAAYKKALLTFHPDRALKSDMRQQVEAEEKFKLINRMKEKFSSVHVST